MVVEAIGIGIAIFLLLGILSSMYNEKRRKEEEKRDKKN